MALLQLQLENPPYRTPLFVGNDRILSKQWVNWFTKTIEALLNASIDDIENLDNDSDINFSGALSNVINSINDLTKAQVSLNNISIQQIKSLLNQFNINLISNNDTQFIKNKITITPIKNVDNDIILNISNHRLIVDSTANTVTLTLPDCSTCKGKEFIIYGFAGANIITVDTVLSQQIKRVSTDTATSDIIILGGVVSYVSQGTYWLANN